VVTVELSVVVPVYNEAGGLEAFFARLVPVLERLRMSYEIICVDDGSTDGTVGLYEALAEDSRVSIQRHAQNQGKGAAIRTAARKVDGGYLVNGAKMFITGGVRADAIVTAVKTTSSGGHHGISFLIIERGPGVESRPLQKLGWHASDTAEISFDDVFVPEENLLGAEHGGFYLIMANFQWERLAMALGAVGAMALAWERTAEFARERQAFGRPLSRHQTIRHKLADLATEIAAARLLTYHAAWLKDQSQPFGLVAAQAKLKTGRLAVRATEEAVQIHGGYGFIEEYPVCRFYRDAKILTIGEGTDEVQQMVIARALGA